jgi:hypothetical protein
MSVRPSSVRACTTGESSARFKTLSMYVNIFLPCDLVGRLDEVVFGMSDLAVCMMELCIKIDL